MNRNEARKAFNRLFNDEDKKPLTASQSAGILNDMFKGPQVIDKDSEDYRRKAGVYMVRLMKVKPQQVYRLPSGIAVRVIRYNPVTHQFHCTSLFDNRRREYDAIDILDGSYLGFRHKRKNDTNGVRKEFSPCNVLIKKDDGGDVA